MNPILLNCLLMDNNEIMFCWRSLGFLEDSEINSYVYEADNDWKLVKFSPAD